ncbi:hypothetical protein ACHAW6_000891 [Cyclotella cf. meneghiniana]
MNAKVLALVGGSVVLLLVLVQIYSMSSCYMIRDQSLSHHEKDLRTDSPGVHLEKGDNNRKPKYLYYYTHSGFANQLIGLAQATQLAHYTNRTLILPPILAHNVRMAGSRCTPYQQSANFIRIAQDDAKKCMSSPEKHQKFSEIMDVSRISRATGTQFIDLKDFIGQEPELTLEYFFRDEPSLHLIDLDGRCTLNHTRPYPNLVEYFQSMYSNKSVAIIPSAYKINCRDTQSHFFQEQILAYPLSDQLSTLLQKLRDGGPSALRDAYIGVHARYGDNYNFNCSSESKQDLLDLIQHETSLSDEHKKNTTPSVYFASSSPTAVTCYTQHLNEVGIPTYSLADFLAGAPDVIRSTVNVQENVLFPVLDQIMVAHGKYLAFLQTTETKKISTYQDAIKMRHNLNQIV